MILQQLEKRLINKKEKDLNNAKILKIEQTFDTVVDDELECKKEAIDHAADNELANNCNKGVNAQVHRFEYNLQTKLSSLEYLLSCNRYEHLINDINITNEYFDANVDTIKNIKKYHDQYIISIATKTIRDFMSTNKYKSKRINSTDLIDKYYKVINDMLLVFVIDEYSMVYLSYILAKKQGIEINSIKVIKMIDIFSYEISDYEINKENIERITNYYETIQEFYNDDRMSEYVDDEKCQTCGFNEYCKKYPDPKTFNVSEKATKLKGVIFE